MTEPVHGIWSIIDALARVENIGGRCVSRLPGVDADAKARLTGLGIRTVGDLATNPLFHAAWDCCHGCEGVEGFRHEMDRLPASQADALDGLFGDVGARALADFRPFHVARLVMERAR